VQEDFELAQLIARGKPGKIDPRLERVASYRQVVERQRNEIDDYLNWYEATQVKKVSGAFRQLLETAKATDEAQPRRRDPISVYLDSIEMEMN
jgi:inorganic pyrophosphatase